MSVTQDEVRAGFVLRDAGRYWVVRPPYDPYGDGYVRVADLEIADDGMVARASATVDGYEENDRSHSQRYEGNEGAVTGVSSLSVDAFVRSLADSWRGWPGVRRWRAMELGLDLDARHDGRGHVSLGVQLSGPRGALNNDDFWSARIVLTFEAGAELDRVAADLTSFVRP